MKGWTKILLITLLFAIPSLLLGQIIWPRSIGDIPPNLLPHFIFISAIESLALGLGIAFLILGFPLLKKVDIKLKKRFTLLFFAILWLLISWWPHDNLHAFIGMDLQKLLYIEYGFHLTLIIASLIIAYDFIFLIKKYK